MTEIDFLRQSIEHLDDKAKADLKVALYGSGFFLAVSLIPYGELPYASLIVAAVDLWYFMSWGNDQLRLAQHRDELKRLEGPDGLETREEQHPNWPIERGLYYATSGVILALFAAALVKDWHVIKDPTWRTLYLGGVGLAFAAILLSFLIGMRRRRALET